MTDLTGGCLCGAVRYRLAAPPRDAGWCHCRTCQLNSGSPAMAFTTIDAGDYTFESGADNISRIASSPDGERWFCRACGTPLLMAERDAPATCDFNLTTLDDPARVTPGFHIFTASAIAWAPIADDLPRYPRTRAEGPA